MINMFISSANKTNSASITFKGKSFIYKGKVFPLQAQCGPEGG